MKKFRAKIALILVLSLTLAVAIPALAAQTTKITGKYEPPAIEVVIPTTASAVINPFNLPVPVTADDGKSSIGDILAPAAATDGTIVTRPLAGYNLSKYNLKISASATATPKGEFMLGTAAGPDKTGVVKLELTQNAYTGTVDTWYYDATTAKTKKDVSLNQLNGPAIVNALNEATFASSQTITPNADKTAFATTADATCVVLAADENTNAATKAKTPYLPKMESIFLARLSGDVKKAPQVSADDTSKAEWTTKDGVDVVVTWTIELDQP